MSGHLAKGTDEAAATGSPPPTVSNAAGIACVAAGALLLSAKGIVAKLMYAQGADVDTVAAVRSVLAVAGFWAWACWRVGGSALVSVSPRHLLLAAGVGLLSYYVGAYVDFYALSLIDASLERVLLFSYPVLIVTVQVVVQRRLPPGRRKRRLVAGDVVRRRPRRRQAGGHHEVRGRERVGVEGPQAERQGAGEPGALLLAARGRGGIPLGQIR